MMMKVMMINARGVMICRPGMKFWGTVIIMTFRSYKMLWMV